MGTVEFLKYFTSKYWGESGFAALFFLGLLAVFVLERDRSKRAAFGWYGGVILLVIYNPLTYMACQFLFSASDSGNVQYYCRLFVLIPVPIIIAYAAALAVEKLGGWKRLAVVAAFCCILMGCGRCIYSRSWFVMADNYGKVPTDAYQLAEMFFDDEMEAESESVRIMAPTDLAVYMRQVDARFSMPYTRYDYWEMDDQLMSASPDVAKVVEFAKKHSVQYIVVAASEPSLKLYLENGCELVGYTNQYIVLTYH